MVDVSDHAPLLPDEPREAFTEALLSFLNSAAVSTSLPRLGVVDQEEPTAQPLGFARSHFDGLTLDGDFAHVLVAGGAYERFSGQAGEAKAIGVAAYAGLSGRVTSPCASTARTSPGPSSSATWPMTSRGWFWMTALRKLRLSA